MHVIRCTHAAQGGHTVDAHLCLARLRVRARARAYQRVCKRVADSPARFTWSAVDGSPRMCPAQRTFAATPPHRLSSSSSPLLNSLSFDFAGGPSFSPLHSAPSTAILFPRASNESLRFRVEIIKKRCSVFPPSLFSSYLRGQGEVDDARRWPTRGDPLAALPENVYAGRAIVEAEQLHAWRGEHRLLGLGLGQRQPFARALPQARVLVRGRVLVGERRRKWERGFQLRKGGAGGAKRRFVERRQ